MKSEKEFNISSNGMFNDLDCRSITDRCRGGRFWFSDTTTRSKDCRLENQQADAQSQIDALESQVSEINTQAQDLLAKQDTLRQESAQLVKDIADLQERIEKREDTIQKQAREAQVSNTSSNYIDAVLNADSLADAIGRVQAMTTMVKANNDLMEQQKQDKKAVEDKSWKRC